MSSLRVHIPVLAVATQKPLFTHNVSLSAAVGAIPLFFGIKIVVGTPVTRLVVVDIDPPTSLTVPALLLLWLFGHVCIKEWNG